MGKPGTFRLLLVLLSACAFGCPRISWGATEDPFSSLSIDELTNGLKIIFAGSGSPRTVAIELRVLSGWDAEEKEAPGVALLTRQIMFRGEGNEPESVLVSRTGGNATEAVEARRTYFRAFVPSIKSTWMLNELSKALMPRDISAGLLETAKQEVLQSLGPPPVPGVDLLALLLQTYFAPPDFAQSEFGITHRYRSPEYLRLQIPLIDARQVQRYFFTHYTPSNIALFIAGPLKKKEILGFVRETYGAYPDRGQPPARPLVPQPRLAPYLHSRLATGMPSVAVGTKFHDLGPEEEVVLRAYLHSLTHRLNATLFARAPETDRAQMDVRIDAARFGYGRIRFRAPAETYSRLRTRVEEQLDAETHGMFSDQEIAQAVEYYLTDLERDAEGTEAALAYADRYFAFRSMYRTEQSPFDLLQTMKPDDFRAHLAKVFTENNRYVHVEEPPALFESEGLVLCLLTLALTLWAWRRWLRREFAHAQLHYMRRIRYGSLLGTFLLVGYGSMLWVLLQGAVRLEVFCYRSTLFQSTYWLNGYGKAVAGIFVFTSFTLGFLTWFPRKLLVVGDVLILKSPTYYAARFPLGEIKEVYVVSPWQVLLYRLWRPSLRILHWTPWRRGLLIRFRDNTGYFLGFRDADTVGRELKEVLQTLRQRPSRHPHHQLLRTRT